MNRPRRTTDLAIITAYLALVALFFYFDSVFLGILTIPWSIPLMMFSGLIVHMTVDGSKFIMLGFIVGAILNSLLFLYSRNRS